MRAPPAMANATMPRFAPARAARAAIVHRMRTSRTPSPIWSGSSWYAVPVQKRPPSSSSMGPITRVTITRMEAVFIGPSLRSRRPSRDGRDRGGGGGGGLRSLRALVRAGDQHVDRRHDEEREERADDHTAHERDADAVPRPGSRPVGEDQGEVAEDRRGGRHQDRPQPGARGLDDGYELVHSGLPQMVRELDDEDSVLGHQPDQRDQADLAINVHRG